MRKWEQHYDKIIDHLFVGVYPMEKDVRMFKLNRDLSLYINKKGEIKGIYIEYYKSDFIKQWKKLRKKITNKGGRL